MSETTDEKIVKLICEREESGIRLLLEEHGSLLKSVIYKYLGEYRDYWEECLDDVLMAVWEHMEEYNPAVSTLANWLCGISRFKALQYIRKYQRPFSELAQGHVLEQREDQANVSAEQEAIGGELPEYLNEMLARLDEKSRKILWKLYVEERTVDELVQELELSKAAVYKRSRRARGKMKEWFAGGRAERGKI